MTDTVDTDTQHAEQLDPRSKGLSRFATFLLAVVAIAAFAVGVPGLVWAGNVAAMPDLTSYLVPVIVDVAMVVVGLAAIIQRARNMSARWMWMVVFLLVALSSAVQSAHAYEENNFVGLLSGIVAVVVAALPPIIILITTHAWMTMVIAPPPTKAQRRREEAKAKRKARDQQAQQPASPRPLSENSQSQNPTPATNQNPKPARTQKVTGSKPKASGTKAKADPNAERNARIVSLRDLGMKHTDIQKRIANEGWDLSIGGIRGVLNKAKKEAAASGEAKSAPLPITPSTDVVDGPSAEVDVLAAEGEAEQTAPWDVEPPAEEFKWGTVA